jgi:CDP-diacylglycerol--glycerol-3-phosphate 3-phosphatidyltransferase
MKYKWIPNFLTSTRIFLVPVFLYFLFSDFNHGKLIAFITFIIASITDAYDGKIARKYNIESSFGVYFDPLADKLLVLSAFYGFTLLPVLSSCVKIWMIILISFRDVLVTLMRTIMQYKGNIMITSKLGKLKTFLQIITISFILIYLILYSYQFELPELIIKKYLFYLMIITTLITFYTGLHYIYYNYNKIKLIFKS